MTRVWLLWTLWSQGPRLLNQPLRALRRLPSQQHWLYGLRHQLQPCSLQCRVPLQRCLLTMLRHVRHVLRRLRQMLRRLRGSPLWL